MELPNLMTGDFAGLRVNVTVCGIVYKDVRVQSVYQNANATILYIVVETDSEFVYVVPPFVLAVEKEQSV